jgi:hypothetical protein
VVGEVVPAALIARVVPRHLDVLRFLPFESEQLHAIFNARLWVSLIALSLPCRIWRMMHPSISG